MPGGVLQFIPFYHPLHDIGGVHTENCVALLALTFFLIAWSADRNPVKDSRRNPGQYSQSRGKHVISLMMFDPLTFLQASSRDSTSVSSV